MTVLYAAIGVIAVLVAVIALNTWVKRPRETPDAQPEYEVQLDRNKIAQHLSGMIRYETISGNTPQECDADAFLGLIRYLEKTYPLVHKTLDLEKINDYSLLYKWAGTGSEKKPICMMAHLDVVPVDERTTDDWQHAPFSGDIADGYVWGRGALDMKGQLCAILESVEYLISQGFAPQRDFYLSFGHDEETMGRYGAQAAVELLEQRGVHFEYVIDEGGFPIDGKVLSIDSMVACIGVCEKGYADVRLTVKSAGGHASRPPKHTAVGQLAGAISALEKKQMKKKMTEPLRMMLGAVGGYMKFPLNVIAANMKLFKPLLLAGFAAHPTSAVFVRTTTAPTMLKGSAAPNVLAERAEAVVNFRISPSDTVEELMAHIKKTVGSEVKADIIQAYDPSPISRTDSDGYRQISGVIRQIFHGYVITPYPMLAATDSRLYHRVADGVYLFQPFRSFSDDMDTMHAANERIAVDSLAEATEFFVRLVKTSDG